MVEEKEVLRIVKGNLVLRNKVVSDYSLAMFKEQARTIRDTDIWKLMIKDLKFTANQRMYEKSTTIDDMIAGKMMLLCIDLLERKVEKLSNMNIKEIESKEISNKK